MEAPGSHLKSLHHKNKSVKEMSHLPQVLQCQFTCQTDDQRDKQGLGMAGCLFSYIVYLLLTLTLS